MARRNVRAPDSSCGNFAAARPTRAPLSRHPGAAVATRWSSRGQQRSRRGAAVPSTSQARPLVVRPWCQKSWRGLRCGRPLSGPDMPVRCLPLRPAEPPTSRLPRAVRRHPTRPHGTPLPGHLPPPRRSGVLAPHHRNSSRSADGKTEVPSAPTDLEPATSDEPPDHEERHHERRDQRGDQQPAGAAGTAYPPVTASQPATDTTVWDLPAANPTIRRPRNHSISTGSRR